MRNTCHTTLTLLPPSPVSNKVDVEIRVGLRNPTTAAATAEIRFYLDHESAEFLLRHDTVAVPANGTAVSAFRWPTRGREGTHRIIAVVRGAGLDAWLSQLLQLIESATRSTDSLDGAFCGFYHWSEVEGRLWNEELRTFTEADWRELVRAQHALRMNIIVPQEMFRNEQYVGKHSIETDGYKGLAFYPSNLFPGRMPIETPDPLECTLAEADRLGMHVFLSLGMYAWFDFSPGSLEWHKQVATELWQRYGHHPSFYGWYVSEEIHGNLGETPERQEELITFFRELRSHCNAMAPGKPVMLATNCHGVAPVADVYRRFLPYLDILCPFGFHRMPEGDLTGAQVADLLQELCDESGTHFWLDQEAFLFKPDRALYPRPIGELVADFLRYPNFEKIICYQFPGLFNRPGAAKTPGGEDTLRLYTDYQDYLVAKGRLPAESPVPELLAVPAVEKPEEEANSNLSTHS